MNKGFIDFVLAHKDDDTARLLLSAARYPDIDMPAAVQQIEGLRTAKEKWPTLLAFEDYRYPPRLNREQASSEVAALYKASLVEHGTIADLTGGMGIDTIALAKVTEHVEYVERDPGHCSLMEYNLKVLGIQNVKVHCADSIQWLSTSNCQLSNIYIDPARRDNHGHKVTAFEDCTPDILAHRDVLLSRCRCLMVKASPMIDIDLACRQLGSVSDVHVVEAVGECKEVLFLCDETEGETMIHCGNHVFSRSDEAAAEVKYCCTVGRYLYEPSAALMKAGPYRSICQWYGVEKLARNTHLYTSDSIVADFPGRRFEVLQEVKLSHKEVAAAIPDGHAHVITRNYPVAAAELQRQLGLKEGGERFIIATTVGSRHCGFLCARF